MYNKIIVDRLNNLTYLSALKNSNASAITKKNPYGDIVKFYAQINKDNVIQAITFKATGCSYFIALSSYFCEIVEGKTIDEALKIKGKDLIAFAELDESKHHIYPLILGTFALLIKKYRKGLENGTIKPCEVSKVSKVEVKKKTSTKKSVDVRDGLGEILVSDSKKVASKSTSAKSSTVVSKTATTTTVTEINSAIAVEEKKSTLATQKKEKELAIKEAKKQAKLEKIEKKAQAKEEKKLVKEEVSSKKATVSKPVKTVETKVAEKKVATKTIKENKTAEPKIEKKVEEKKALTLTSDRLSKITAMRLETKTVSNETKVDSMTDSKPTKVVKETKPAKKAAKVAKEKVVVEDKKKETKTTDKKETKKVTAKKVAEKKESTVKTQALVKQDNEVVVSNSIPEAAETINNQVIVEHVETKRRVETIRRGGSTQTIEAHRTDALTLNAEGKDVHKEVHSAANLSDMLNRLNASKTTKVNNLEVRSDISAKKTVDGKVVDSKSATHSFSSMRDSLQKMRLNNETKALPDAKSTKAIENKEDKKEESQKKGFFSRLFKK